MKFQGLCRASAVLIAAATGFGATNAAHADYFVRPVLQYQGSLVDGLKLNGATSGSQTFSDGATTLESHVDLANGTIKMYNARTGPASEFTGSTGVMGEQIRYTGDSDTPVQLNFDYDVDVSGFFEDYGFPPEFDSRYLAVDAYFAVFEAGTGANWAEWTVLSAYADQALYNGRDLKVFDDVGDDFSVTYSGTLGADLNLVSGKSYDIFAAFNLLITPGDKEGWVTMNSLNTSTIGITAPGGTFTSQSGSFLGFAQTPAGAIPEPSTWAMMIIGFGLIGASARRRPMLVAA